MLPEVFSPTLATLRNWLRECGILYASLMQAGGYYFNFNNSVSLDNGMRLVQLKNGDIDREVDVWFVSGEEDLRERHEF